MARSAGSTAGEQRATLGTQKAVDTCPATKDALAAGEVSLAQAGQIASVPEHEAELLDLARTSSARTVKDPARKLHLEAIDPEDLFTTQQAAHEFVHWKDDLGMIRFREPYHRASASLVNRLDAETDRESRRRPARRPPRSRATDAADAFVRMLDGAGKGPRRISSSSRTCAAYQHGHAHPGERSHLIGGGPIPVLTFPRLSGLLT